MRYYRTMLFVAIGFILSGTALADVDYGTKDEAKSLVKKAVAYIKTNGVDIAALDFNNKKGDFTVNDLYVVMYSFEGDVLAHGQNKKSVGKNLIDQKDPDGKEFIRERVNLAKKNNSFWQEYKFTDPITKKILDKEAYCEVTSNVIVCSGAYKR
jgi:cytochrome c